MKHILLLLAFALISTANYSQSMSNTIYQFEMDNIQGQPVSLESYAGNVVLIVNVASECGLTPQYADLQELYLKYKDRGLVILGFPANNFGAQEPGSNDQIQTFCRVNYGVEFPMFSKISVKGEDQHPLYQFLTNKEQNGVLDSDVQWNFQKYLIDKEGHLVRMIEPVVKVTEPEILQEIEGLL